jgi:hypothetical protein
MRNTQERPTVMKRLSLVSIGLAGLALACVLPVTAHAEDTFSVGPQQMVSFGAGNGDADTFAVEQIPRNDNMVTVLLRPKGESCTFRFDVGVGRSVQLRSDGPSGQSMVCKATLQPITEDGAAQFGAECSEAPVSAERKCPPAGDTAAITSPYPQQ